MKCWHCNTELSWGGDHNDEDGDGREMIVTNLSCPKCESFVLVYYTKKKEEDEGLLMNILKKEN